MLVVFITKMEPNCDKFKMSYLNKTFVTFLRAEIMSDMMISVRVEIIGSPLTTQ